MFIILFIVILGVLVLVHEAGHFFAARKAGVRVEEFGFGIPPRVWGKKIGKVLYSLNLLPIGGFVRIFGEEGEHANDPESFSSRRPSVRVGILAAGVLMNVALAWVLFSFGHVMGFPTAIEDAASTETLKDVGVQVVEVIDDSPAKQAGVKPGDFIVGIEAGGEIAASIAKSGDVSEFLGRHPGEEITMDIKRGKEHISLVVKANEEYIEGKGFVGVGLALVGRLAYPWYEAPFRGLATTFESMWVIIVSFSALFHNIFAGKGVALDVAGPVGIAILTREASQLGLIYLIQFVAWISLHLALLNIVPFPALDGGRILFVMIEKIKGSPVAKNVEKMIHTAGFAILIVFIIFITMRDIGRFL
jgi:regulator of sigma E protease